MQKIIGAITSYNGNEHSYLKGLKVRIVGVLKGAASPSYDPDSEGAYLTDNESLALAGGVTSADRIKVQPWIAKERRFSFASSDPRATELECFAHLTR